MSNDYYNVTGGPANSGPGSSSQMRAEFALAAAGFDKAAPLTGNALKLVRINSAGTAQEAQPGSGSETLFTPTLIGIGAPAYTAQAGRISKVGPYAFVEIVMTWTGGTDATAFTIEALPYQAINTSVVLTVAANQNSGALTWTGQLIARISAVPSVALQVWQMQSGVSYLTTPLLNRNAGTKDLRINGYYVWA